MKNMAYKVFHSFPQLFQFFTRERAREYTAPKSGRISYTR